jgi:predicted phage terminase large subunit-like protein
VNEYIKIIEEIVGVMKNDKALDEFTRLKMADNLYNILVEYYNSPKATDENKIEIERSACKYSIIYLIPYTYNNAIRLINEGNHNESAVWYELWQKAYALAGRKSLEHFIDYMEMEMPSSAKVLGNRRKVLKPLVYFLNKSYFDPKLEYIEASFPPSYGKTYTLNMFSAWVYGQNIDNTILRLSYSQELVLTASRAIQNTIKEPRYSDIFPYFKKFEGKPFDKEKESDWIIKGSNTQTSHISRTRDGAVTGVRANTAIIFDDMTKGAEEAVDSTLHERLYSKWKTEWYNRRTGRTCKFVFAGTMWSPEDILNRVVKDIEATHVMHPSKIKGFEKWVQEADDGTAVVIKVPLLDENDRTTCEHVMTTKEALMLRDTTDEFSFSCVYQQDPIAPTGLEFADTELQHFTELPKEGDEDLCGDYSFAALDPARRGKDYVSMPICKTDSRGNYYMIDCLFKKEAMSELYDRIVDKIVEHKIIKLVLENNVDTSLKALLLQKLEAKGYNECEIVEKFNTKVKEQRIKNMRGEIKRKIFFKQKKDYKPNSDYGVFMKNLTTYSFDYPNKHDDAPDSIAMFAEEIILGKGIINKPRAINRSALGI